MYCMPVSYEEDMKEIDIVYEFAHLEYTSFLRDPERNGHSVARS